MGREADPPIVSRRSLLGEHAIIRVTIEAGEIMTAEQWAAVGAMTGRHDVRVWQAGIDLPAGYVEFAQVNGVTGGIAPDGQVST